MSDLANIKLLEQETIERPYDAYDRLRKESPVYRVPESGVYIVTRYDLVMEAVRNTDVFSSAIGAVGFDDAPKEVVELFEKEGYQIAHTMVSADPPTHTRYRNLVNGAFTASRVRGMQSYIQQIVDELIDEFIDRGGVEFVTEFAIKLPIFVIADQLGVSRGDGQKFKDWSDALVPTGLDLGLEAELDRAKLAIEYQKYFTARIEEARADPKENIIGDLVCARLDDGRPLNNAELLSIIQQLLTAGNETTTNALGAGLVLLMENPDQVVVLHEGGEKEMRTFCEEVIRLEAPVSGLFRITTQDTELGGFAVPSGSMVNLRWASANRDPAVFDEPTKLDVCRKNAGAQIGYGVGIHFCVGAMLAREELYCGFSTLLHRLENIRLTDPNDALEHHHNFVLRGLKTLQLNFDKAEQVRVAE